MTNHSHTSCIDLAIIGAGAAGVFTAIIAKEQNPRLSIALFEAGDQALSKVRISGGGRCNVTHHEFNPSLMAKGYPRGKKELRALFNTFQPKNMIEWLNKNGVKTITEEDGRMFPASQSSQTIIDLFLSRLSSYKVPLHLNTPIKSVFLSHDVYVIHPKDKKPLLAKNVLIATGGSPAGFKLAKNCGHTIIPPVPSLFTFKINDPRLQDLPGISFPNAEISLKVNQKKYVETGPVLITHWGLSGPALIKLSAWAARDLAQTSYQAELRLNLFPGKNEEAIRKSLSEQSLLQPQKNVGNGIPEGIPKRFWLQLLSLLAIPQTKLLSQLSKKNINQLSAQLCSEPYSVTGRGIFKQEFVTAGGVSLKEVHLKKMESKKSPHLFFAGEVLDMDGITGGFNFQSAWTTGYIVAHSIANKKK